MIKAVLIDFGGVIAGEGFADGLRAIAGRNGIEPEGFFSLVDRLIMETGYLIGRADEAAFWDAVRSRTGLREDDAALTKEIIDRFVIRPSMLGTVDRIRQQGIVVALVTDQTDWIELIDRKENLFRSFDRVFNSFRMHKSKRDATVFTDICSELQIAPSCALFIDDNSGHIERARLQGLQTILFTAEAAFKQQLSFLLPQV